MGKIKIYKILVVFGTRPEAIKLAPLIVELKSGSNNFEVVTCVSGQHRQMLDQVLEIFEISPDIDLNLMKFSQSLSELTAALLTALQAVLITEKPDLVLVHGDTSTAFSAALAAFYQGVPIGHVEAGLRTYNIFSPYPEEFNREVVSKLAAIHFAPTEDNQRNLLAEGVPSNSIHVTGNTVVDALQMISARLDTNTSLQDELVKKLSARLGFQWVEDDFVLITSHRRENFGGGLTDICQAIIALSRRFPEMQFVFPVHLNPNVLHPVKGALEGISNVHLIEPLDYISFMSLLRTCLFVLTDSGGLQEEAPSFNKPLVLMRESTERPEAIKSGGTILVGTNVKKIIDTCERLILDKEFYNSHVEIVNPFGQGDSSKTISEILQKYLKYSVD